MTREIIVDDKAERSTIAASSGNTEIREDDELYVVELLQVEDLGPVVKERHIDFLLQEELQVNSYFLCNFVRSAAESFVRTAAQEVAIPAFIDAAIRPNLRVNSALVKHSIADANGESDLILLYKLEGSDETVAILVEDKIHAPFQKEQAERYKQRGLAGEKEQPPKWVHHWTCLVAPDSYIKRGHGFDSAVQLEQIKTWFRSKDICRVEFKVGVIDKAIRKAAIIGSKVIDPIITAFRESQYGAFKEFFADQLDSLSIRPPANDYGDTWFKIKFTQLPGGPYITHKSERGFVDLTFPHTDAELLKGSGLKSVLEPGMNIEPTGKSASIRLHVDPIKDFSSFDEQKSIVESAFEAGQKLISFYARERVRLNECVARASNLPQADAGTLNPLDHGA